VIKLITLMCLSCVGAVGVSVGNWMEEHHAAN
jgi:hypothetical protein